MFRLGEVIIGNELNEYSITNDETPCMVTSGLDSDGEMKVMVLEGCERGTEYWVVPRCFEANAPIKPKSLYKLRGMKVSYRSEVYEKLRDRVKVCYMHDTKNIVLYTNEAKRIHLRLGFLKLPTGGWIVDKVDVEMG